MSDERARAIVPVRVWIGLGAAVFFVLALAAPWMAAHRWVGGFLLLRQFFSPVCHQDTMRSFWFWGAPAAVCARCLGIYLGAAVGAIARIERRLAMWAFAIMLLGNCADAVSEFVGWHGSLPQVRFLLGIMLGVSISALVAGSAQVKNPTQATPA
jgi:uncharacterized membrane protein